MIIRIFIAALAALAVCGPAAAMRHADVVYFQQFKIRQLLLAEAARAKRDAAPQQVAAAPAAPAAPPAPPPADTTGS